MNGAAMSDGAKHFQQSGSRERRPPPRRSR